MTRHDYPPGAAGSAGTAGPGFRTHPHHHDQAPGDDIADPGEWGHRIPRPRHNQQHETARTFEGWAARVGRETA